MTDPATRQTVQQLVLDHVASNAMFTAYDITLFARAHGVQLRHDEGRDIVHEMFQNGILGVGYRRSVIDVGAPSKPFLYHPFTSDPNTYRSSASGANVTPQSATGPQTSARATTSSRPPGILQRIVSTFLGGTSNPSTAAGANARSPQRVPVPRQPPVRRASVTLDLDASGFLPISRDELQRGASRTNLWGNPWFGRRDLIPPVSDDRTQLIDRAMVTQGLITPEELAEIHRVGALMDHFRPSETLARFESQQAGAAAVEQERQRQQTLKAKKKAEAAEKNEAYRRAVAERKTNDIIFLGRGVSGRLNDRTSDTERLQSLDVQLLSTPADVAVALGISVSKLRWLAFHNEVASRTHYVRFEIAKRSGGVRSLCSPHKSLATAQQWILSQILDKLPTESAAHGFIRTRSIVTGAVPHVGHDILINMDLENFFPSITFPRVRHLFQRIGYSPAVATVLALLCTECPRRTVIYAGQPYLVAIGPRGLPQGACTSPAISNQIARRLDRRMQGLATKMELTYSRYADDLSLSGNQELASRIGYVMACARHMAQDEGFTINEKKTRVLRRNSAQIVTGLVVNDRVAPTRQSLRRIRSILHHAKTEGLNAQNRDDHPDFRAWLGGYISFIAMTRPDLARTFQQQLVSVRD